VHQRLRGVCCVVVSMSGTVESMTIAWEKGLQLSARVRSHRIVADQPKEEGGDDAGVTPVEMLVASLGTCIGFYAVRFCQRHRIATDGLTVDMSWGYAERPHRIGSLAAKITLPVALEPSVASRLQNVVEHCTVHNSIKVAPAIAIELVMPEGQPVS
jgi:putative redox protein